MSKISSYVELELTWETIQEKSRHIPIYNHISYKLCLSSFLHLAFTTSVFQDWPWRSTLHSNFEYYSTGTLSHMFCQASTCVLLIQKGSLYKWANIWILKQFHYFKTHAFCSLPNISKKMSRIYCTSEPIKTIKI